MLESFLDSNKKGLLSNSQRQAVIKLLEKKRQRQKIHKNWRPISLINYDAKLLSKTLAERLKLVLPSIIKNDQTAYVKNRFLGESVRLISDILETTKKLNIEGFIMTIDIEKAFDSLDHAFLFALLKKFNIDPEFINWIKVLTNSQESCVINGGVSTGLFPLERGTRQGDPISAYLFIMAMEAFFTMVRSDSKVKGLDIYGFNYLLTSYADDTTFFLKDETSALHIFSIFTIFSEFSGLKVNKSKCEIAGIGLKSGAKTTLSDVKNINLLNNFLKILWVCFNYDN